MGLRSQAFSGVNWTLIILIVAGSAVLAYLGDVLGFKYGKQRISIFGLRPRYTSRLITAFTGVLISVVVLAALSFFSENVRTALFTMKTLQQDLERLSVQLKGARADLEEARIDVRLSQRRLAVQESLWQTAALSLDVARIDLENLRAERDLLVREKNDLDASVVSLREEVGKMTRELETMRQGSIMVRANSLLARGAVLPGTPRERVLETLDVLKADARALISDRRSGTRGAISGGVKLSIDPAEESQLVERLTGSPERMYVRLLAAANIAADEEVKIRFDSGRSYYLYDEGEILYRKLVYPSERGYNAEDLLHIFLREMKLRAVENGVLPDPATNDVGFLFAEEFFEVVEKLGSSEGPTIINAVVSRNLYTEGPVSIKIVLE
ncbi:MAG: DUF3084 domain-containing protein [Synergistaceae bacterium]|jgi:uncharacterized protein (DUF3084 family)|nr:DUF3084 domain-containing protein [Synergistaceae bacterium]